MITFHRVLIATAIAFCLAMAAWLIVFYRGDGQTMSLVLGIAFTAAAAGLAYYLKNLNRFLRR